MHFCIARTLLAITTHVFPGFSTPGRVVDGVYWLIDCGAGTMLLALVGILSIGGIMERIQVSGGVRAGWSNTSWGMLPLQQFCDSFY